mmetsp:Transcript_811/g.859  ORF Transcript_811/g.859 Transcript_811/m.859 type:complete len:83 (-) Transcript_811:649-897(-)
MAVFLLRYLVNLQWKTVMYKRTLEVAEEKEKVLSWVNWSYLGYFESIHCDAIGTTLSLLDYNQRLLIYYSNTPEEAAFIKIV